MTNKLITFGISGILIAGTATGTSIVQTFWSDPVRIGEKQYEFANRLEQESYEVVKGLEVQLKNAKDSHALAKESLTNTHCQLIGAKLSKGLPIAEEASNKLMSGDCTKKALGEL